MNENNPPMVLPNGYVYGENVSLDPFVIAFFWFLTDYLPSEHNNHMNAEVKNQKTKKNKKQKKKGKEYFIQFYMTWLTADHTACLWKRAKENWNLIEICEGIRK